MLAALATHACSLFEIPELGPDHKFQIAFSVTASNSQKPETQPTKAELKQGRPQVLRYQGKFQCPGILMHNSPFPFHDTLHGLLIKPISGLEDDEQKSKH